jgi:predicted O-methyltransferase YrrM
MHKLQMAVRYLSYWLNAVDEHSLQPPFIFKLYTSVIKSERQYYAFEDIERSRRLLLQDERLIELEEMGAGSKVNKAKKRAVKDLAKHSLTPQKFSRLLYRFIATFQPKHIIELGTSLGINTLYLSYYDSRIRVATFEGCHETAEIARRLFLEHQRKNIELIEGNIDQTLPEYIKNCEPIDLAYFDANHRKEATLRYFESCLQKAHDESIFIFDDIHWSKEMEEAWKAIKKHPKVTLSLDLFEAGIVFFDRQMKKQHYILNF